MPINSAVVIPWRKPIRTTPNQNSTLKHYVSSDGMPRDNWMKLGGWRKLRQK